MIVAALTVLAGSVLALTAAVSRDTRDRRRQARRQVIDQDNWRNPLFTQGLRTIGGLPPHHPTQEDTCERRKATTAPAR